MNKNNFIAVTGVLGSGKTTIGKNLSKELNYEFIEECWEENPYLVDFYKGKYLLETEEWFIKKDIERYEKAISFLKEGKGVVIDKPLYLNHVYIDISPLSELYKNKCHKLIQESIEKFKIPDLVIYIMATPSVINERVLQRGRTMEKNLDIKWFRKFLKAYKYEKSLLKNINSFDLDTEKYNFSTNLDSSLEYLLREIDKRIK